MNRIILAGTSSGAGKTTISAGLMRALCRRGKKVIPFKVGPDYIDTGFHQAAAGRCSINLDSWMTGVENTRFLFEHHSRQGDMAVIEGVMGLFDGLGDDESTASTAHIAKILQAPVILIIDGSQMATSAAALVLGYREYDKAVNVAGVIVNHVSSETHYQIIREAIERRNGIPCLGYLPTKPEISLPSRHLGLIPDNETERLQERIEMIAEFIEGHLDLDVLEGISSIPWTDPSQEDPRTHLRDLGKGMRIGIARDDAFSFYYEDNIDLIRYMGMEIVPFSPLKDPSLPDDLHALYLGGGFPEIFAERLSANVPFRRSLVTFLEEGMPVYAECGGYMYLTHGIRGLDGSYHEMAGFLEGSTQMTQSLQRFGYAEVTTSSGHCFRGHEFHHSRWVGPIETPHTLLLKKPELLKKEEEWRCGQRKENVHGAYVHLHFYSNLNAVKEVILSLKKYWRLINEQSKI